MKLVLEGMELEFIGRAKGKYRGVSGALSFSCELLVVGPTDYSIHGHTIAEWDDGVPLSAAEKKQVLDDIQRICIANDVTIKIR